MGDLRFQVSKIEDYDPRIWETAFITGIEGIPWLCHHSIDGEQFNIGREIDESGKLNIVWPSECLGNTCLSSTSLRVVDAPYALVVELARGTVHRLKSQTWEWQRIGLKLPDGFFPLAEASLAELLHALTDSQDLESQQLRAQKAIELALEAIAMLSESYSAQALDARKNNEGRLATLLGVRLGAEPSLARFGRGLGDAFNLACVSADYGSVETSSGGADYAVFDQQLKWAAANDKKICVGPLIDFRDGRFPEWMFLLDEGFESVLQAACHHAQRTVERYKGQTQLWNCAAGLNVPNRMSWSDEEVLRMAVSVIETVRRTDERCPVLLTISQPWSEHLRNDANGISPLHFADALIRADLGLSGLALELDFETWPGGSFPRDPVEVSRLVDRWSMLGLPLMMSIRCSTDTHAGDERSVKNWPLAQSRGQVSPESIIHMLLSKPCIHGVIWDQLSDTETSNCGLLNAVGEPNPLLQSLTQLRRDFLH